MQDLLQKQMAELRVEGNAGGGMVTVVVNGAKQVQSIKIDPEVVSKDEVEMLQDLIAAAVPAPPDPAAIKKSALREQALADAGVQAMLEVFPAEIRDIEEM